MGIKSYLIKKTLQYKGGMSKDDAERVAEMLEKNPGLSDKLKVLEENKEVKALFEKIQKETEEKKKTMPEQLAVMSVMTKYKSEIAKYREELMPLMELMMSVQGK